MANRIRTHLPGAIAVILFGAVLAGCGSSEGTPSAMGDTTTTTLAETSTTAALETTTMVSTTTTTVPPTTSTTLAPTQDPDHPFYDPFEGVDEPKVYMWMGGFGEFDEAIDLMMGTAAQGGVVPTRGCDSKPVSSPCYEVERHTHQDDKYHVAVISLRLTPVHESRDGRDYYVEVRSEDGREWHVTKEAWVGGVAGPPRWVYPYP